MKDGYGDATSWFTSFAEKICSHALNQRMLRTDITRMYAMSTGDWWLLDSFIVKRLVLFPL